MTPDFEKLKSQCAEVHDCSNASMLRSRHSGDRRELKRAEKKRQAISDIAAYAKTVYEKDPNQDPEYFTQSVIALMLPWLLRWLLPVFERLIIDWFAKQLFPDP